MNITQLSDKQQRCISESTARLNLAWGSVRSGKSVALEQLRWPHFVSEQDEGDLLMIGRTLNALERNVLRPMKTFYGPNMDYSLGKKKATLFGREVDLEGANNDAAYKKIQGMTCGGALINELTLIPETMFQEVLSRLSVKGAKLFATMNPEGPNNYVKKNYIDRAGELDLRHWKFLIDENIALDPAYVDALKKEYTGIWYKRYILSHWVAAEGAVYDMFDEDVHVVQPNDIPKCYRYWFGVDYGTATTTHMLMLGQDRSGIVHVLDEFVWDAKAKGRQKTDTQLSNDLFEFQKGISHTGVMCDPSAVSFMLQSKQSHGIKMVPANNEVLEGIRNVSSLLSNGFLKISTKCPKLIDEMHSYCWDSTQQDKGIDKPLKQADHGVDSLRYSVRTKRSYWKKYLLKNKLAA